MTTAQKEFIQKVSKYAGKGKILASLTIAQAILESGWGKSELARKGNALFGIKASRDWTGKTYSIKTKEYYANGTPVIITATFRAYDNWEQSIADHDNLISSKARYAKVVNEKDYVKACMAIKAAGYSTAPDYADKLISLIEKYKLYEYDKEVKTMSKTKDNTPASWAKEAVDWAVKNKILFGDENGDFKLSKACTRQEMIVFLYRVFNLLR